MANPIVINSTNIVQFGFKTTFNLELNRITFDITGLTTFVSGNAGNVLGIFFSVYDASGLQVATPDFNNSDIDPTAPVPFVVQLPNGFAQYGVFTIRGIIIDQDGTNYTVELIKDICQPNGYNTGAVKGSLNENVDCNSPKISISETTNFSYAKKAPISVVKSGTLFYPNGTIASVSFTFTPFEVNVVYTGAYQVKNTSIATYDLLDSVYVEVTYKSTLNFDVTCQSELVSLLCCIKDYEDQYLSDPNSARGRNAKALLDKITIPFFSATVKEKAGQDAGAEVKIIADILGCDCQCNEVVEPSLVGGGTGASNVTISGAGGSTVTSSTSGDTVNYTVASRTATVTKDPGELGFSIQTIVTTFNTEYKITFNINALAEEILNVIANDQDLLLILQQLIGSTGSSPSLAGLDGACVITIGNCTYTLIENSAIVKTINSITINGVVHNSPTGLLLTDTAGIVAWLNGLSLGTFTAVLDSGSSTVTINSTTNPNTVTAFNMTVQGSPLIRQFTKTCVALVDVLNAIISYICTLQTNEIIFGYTGANLCSFSGSTVVTTPVPPNTTLDALLVSILSAQCVLYNTILSSGISCAALQAAFPPSAAAVVSTDSVFGIRGGACARVTFSDLAGILLSTISGNDTLRAAFCAIVALCTAPSCSAPTSVSGVLTTGPVCVAVTNIIATAS